MRAAVAILCSCLALAIACKKHVAPTLYPATITRPDPRTGPCDGGTFIQIDGHPNPRDTAGYDIGTVPSYFSFENLKYPTRVKIAYQITGCDSNIVDISQIQIVP